jgi:two-component system capsular synthesis response regulator RcsB
LADDHGIVRYGIRSALEADGIAEVVEEAANSDELIAIVKRTDAFDAIVTDFMMPGERTRDGTALLGQLGRRCPDVPIIVITAMRNAAVLNEMLSHVRVSLVEKAGNVAELRKALLAAAQGRTYISPGIERLLASVDIIGSKVGAAPRITKAEMEVLRLFVMERLTPKQISERLNRSVKTTSRHKRSVMEKMGLRTTQELLEFCQRSGMFTD